MSLRIVIIGGVAGGMSAATRARRINESASITVLEKGGYISFANCGLPYHIAGRITPERKLLLTTPEAVRKRYNIDARVHHEATRIDRAARVVHGIDRGTQQPFTLAYDKLILAPGAAAIIPPIANVRAPNVLPMRSMEDTAAVQKLLEARHPQRAVVVGAGFIGLEMAEALHDRGLKVTLVEKAPHALPMLDEELVPWLHQELAAHGVELIAGTALAKLHAVNGMVNAVETEDGRRIETDMVILSIGVRPNIELAKSAGPAIGASGAIAVDEYQRTSDADIYAAGDAAEVAHGITGKVGRVPLAGPANRQGRLAGEHAARGDSAAAGRVMGTAIVQVFGLSVGTTGLGATAAKTAGFEPDFAFIHPAHHAGYYPGAQAMHLKLIYDRPTRRVLGAQIVGGEGVDKRLDVIATAMHFKGTIDDLAQLDLAYAPQFGSAKDPVHYAAFVAQNQMRSAAISPRDLADRLILDVRTPEEFSRGTLAGAINMPVDELRGRLGQIDRSRPIAILCQVGLRGWVAQNILRQSGFTDVANVKGGYALAGMMTKN